MNNQEENVSTESIITRILEDYEIYAERNRKKEEKAKLEAELEEKARINQQ
jgi:fructoselysine-6-P-deglycase FrlB-like protein